MAELDYVRVDYREPHLERTRRMLKEHPELKELFGPVLASAFFVLALVVGQVALAAWAQTLPWWGIVLLAFGVGAFIVHGLWVLIHEATHNLVFKGNRANSLLAIFANLPILFPSAMSFRKYHLLHHRFQGDPDFDADLASPREAKLVGNRWYGKALWLLFFFLFQANRVRKLRIQFFDGWYAFNLVVCVAFIGGAWALLGGGAMVYLFLSSVLAIGLHPCGARWIQEHFLTAGPQETYSYYGPLNLVSFNVGFHNEHHDLMRVPWTRLPEVKRRMPQMYEPLVSHTSWTKLLLRFLFDPKLSLYSRVVRSAQVSGSPAKKVGLVQVERDAHGSDEIAA